MEVQQAKTKQTSNASFPVPFSKEELHRHSVTLFLHHVRVLGWMTDPEAALRVFGKTALRTTSLHDPDAT